MHLQAVSVCHNMMAHITTWLLFLSVFPVYIYFFNFKVERQFRLNIFTCVYSMVLNYFTIFIRLFFLRFSMFFMKTSSLKYMFPNKLIRIWIFYYFVISLFSHGYKKYKKERNKTHRNRHNETELEAPQNSCIYS